jgi:antitoxin HicB
MMEEPVMSLSFTVHLVRDDGGSVMATCPDFPEVSTFGVNPDDALDHARDAVQKAVENRRANGQDLPQQSPELAGALRVTVE